MAEDLIKKLAYLKHIHFEEEAGLRDTFFRAREVRKGENVLTQGENQNFLYVVKTGWFFSYAMLPGGSRQIHEIFTAGDVINVENLSWPTSTASVTCALTGELHFAPVGKVTSLFQQHQNLDSVFRALQTVQNTLLIDRLTAVSRLDAYNRVAYFLSDALARQNLVAENQSDVLYLPLSQNLIADCLGLSSVHVSRQYGKLINEGLIQKIGRKSLKILNIESLQAKGDYKNRFGNLALSKAA